MNIEKVSSKQILPRFAKEGYALYKSGDNIVIGKETDMYSWGFVGVAEDSPKWVHDEYRNYIQRKGD